MSTSSTSTLAAGITLLAVLAANSPAQGTLVSPPFAATVEGRHAHPLPWSWSTPLRYQQIHGDVGGAPRALRGLAWRPNQASATFTGVRSFDLEAWAGHARPHDRASLAFAANYVGPRTLVVGRRRVDMGPQGGSQPPAPNPFTSMQLAFDVPFLHDGVRALAWEVAIHGSSLTGGSWNHADAELAGGFVPIRETRDGTGCNALGQPAPMLLYFTGGQGGRTLYLSFLLTCAPANAPTVLALGTRDPDAFVPGLCSNLRTDLVALLPMGSTDPLGEIGPGGPASLLLPNPGGGRLHAQYHSLEPVRADPIAVCNSNGLVLDVPAPGSDGGVRVTRLYAESPAATHAVFEDGGTVHAGLVTLFRF